MNLRTSEPAGDCSTGAPAKLQVMSQSSHAIESALEASPVVPLILGDEPESAVRMAEALVEGGLPLLEIVLRTDAALDCLEAISERVEGAIAGAGTVLNADQAGAAVERGATFLVSPGLDDGVISVAREQDLPVYPGIFTPGELQRAWNLGLRVVKFFPAAIAGGVPALKALSSVFGDMRFMPTGGISAANLADYLSLPAVVACGGSWLTPKSAVEARDYAEITRLAREAVAVAAATRPLVDGSR